MSAKYTEHTHSQSGTQDSKQCQIIQCKKMGSSMVNNNVCCLCQSSKSWSHIHVHVTRAFNNSASKEQTLDCWLSQALLAIVGFGQRFPIRYSLMAKPWQKRPGTIWIHPVSCTWPAGHGFERPLLKAAGSYQQMNCYDYYCFQAMLWAAIPYQILEIYHNINSQTVQAVCCCWSTFTFRYLSF